MKQGKGWGDVVRVMLWVQYLVSRDLWSGSVSPVAVSEGYALEGAIEGKALKGACSQLTVQQQLHLFPLAAFVEDLLCAREYSSITYSSQQPSEVGPIIIISIS